MSAIEKAIDTLEPGDPVAYMNLTLYPLFGGDHGRRDYLTLDEALGRGLIEIAEVSAAGSVPELTVTNKADQAVLLLDGEELVGAKQNRLINLTVLVPAATTLKLPVSCVESGRWRSESRSFSSSPRAVFSELRAAKLASVSDSMRRRGRHASDQGEVWNSIRMKMGTMEVQSGTEAMSDIFASYETRMDGFMSALRPQPQQVGAVFAIDGEVRGMDLFDHPDTLERLLPKLVRSYALDAMDRARKSENSAARPRAELTPFMARVRRATPATYPALGLGTDLRIDERDLCGGALEFDNRVVHLCAFRRAEGSGKGEHYDRSRDRRFSTGTG